MWRAIAVLIEWVFIFLVARSVIRGITSLFRQSPETAARPDIHYPPSELQSAGELRKDPVCGTYIAVPSAWSKAVKDDTIYFCSKECKDKFRA